MDYPSYEIRWRCYNLKCPLLSIHGIHSSALVGCLEHKQFCTYFNVPFQVLYASDQKKKTQSSTSERKINLKKPSVMNTMQDEDEKGLPDLIVYYSDIKLKTTMRKTGHFMKVDTFLRNNHPFNRGKQPKSTFQNQSNLNPKQRYKLCLLQSYQKQRKRLLLPRQKFIPTHNNCNQNMLKGIFQVAANVMV